MQVTATDWIDGLRQLNACEEAITFAQGYGSLGEAWTACERADWLLWLIARVSGAQTSAARKRLVLCACACARTALPHVRAGETRPLAAIETAERSARGEGPTLTDVRAAADAAYAAAAAAAAAAADAAYAARWREARLISLKQLADVVRQHYPEPPELSC